jgi:hypothetical protein
MKRISRITIGRLSPRATVLTGAALGLCAGVTVYGAVSSAAESPTAFKAIAVAKAPAPAPVRYANCAAGAKLENGFCVTHVVKTVLAAPVAGATVKPASASTAVTAVKVRTATVATPTSATAAPVAPSTRPPATPSEDAAPAPQATSTASPAPALVPAAAS